MNTSPTLTPQHKDQFIQDGYIVMRGLIPLDVVNIARQQIQESLQVDENDPATWVGKNVVWDEEARAATVPCRTPQIESVAEQLVGPHFVPGLCFSPYLETRGEADPLIQGFIPVLQFPTPGAAQWVRPSGWHIDGMKHTTLWPDKHFLIVFAYLNDVPAHGGATTILPGSHRQVFEHWVTTQHPGSTVPPDLPYAEPIPMPGQAGDVIFMHYLTVHSGSENRSAHIRYGLNTAVMPDPQQPYERKAGSPRPNWTPLDWTLRTDNLPS
ncbi:MAG: phytanoyl-CoA dioxygenase family protein [Abitibacteriaceae bacterium]|nr:phytanoyl-CoA dioxygenase family protein [Abditibacteriaceae bacterium]